MKEWKCQKYMDMLERDSLSVGTKIPELMEINGREIPLKKLAFEISSEGEVPDEYELEIREIKIWLRKERNQIVEKIENCTVSTESEAEKIVDKVKSIDRASSVMSDPGETDVEGEIKRKQAIKQKKWQDFLKKIQNDDNSRFE